MLAMSAIFILVCKYIHFYITIRRSKFFIRVVIGPGRARPSRSYVKHIHMQGQTTRVLHVRSVNKKQTGNGP